MQFKSTVLAAALALAAAGSHADVINLGDVPPTATFAGTVAGVFTNTYQFTLTGDYAVSAGALNFSVFAPYGLISGFSASLNGQSLLGNSSSTNVAPGVTFTSQSLAGLMNLSAGTYTLTVSGDAGAGATFTGYVQAVPVPEPETYAMLAAGLGVIGFVASRRRRDI
ncbi:MAG: FxDxF family PEP-CTERM protein [Roseateles sp.]|uniref:FxDxF family PEP-CTERM protein n=1 Tax=Roseateles sp. TaxID=1971397 RepID=UPI0039E8EEDC